MNESSVDLSQVPISALRVSTRQILEALNERRVLPTDVSNIPRDWQGLVQLTGVCRETVKRSKNHVDEIMKLWEKDRLDKGQQRPSLKEFQEVLGQIDRWDIYDDSEEMMLKDAQMYVDSLKIKPASEQRQLLQQSCLTSDDVDRLRDGKSLLKYDALILHAEEDSDHADQMYSKLVTDYGLRVVVKDRHLLPGRLEFESIIKLITDRCASLIVIISPNFLKSEVNKFFLAFALSEHLSPEQRIKRIIPCKYEPCVLPKEISFLYVLDYQKALRYGNFWSRINNSVDSALTHSPPNRVQNRYTITEISSEEIQQPSKAVIPEPSIKGPIAIAKESDPSTHFPGNSLKESYEKEWAMSKSTVSETDIYCEPTKVTNKIDLISRLSKMKKGFSKKKRAVALEVSETDISCEPKVTNKIDLISRLNKMKKGFSRKKRAVALEA